MTPKVVQVPVIKECNIENFSKEFFLNPLKSNFWNFWVFWS